MNQDQGSIAKLTKAVIDFRDERDWAQFHNPKDVALSLVLESTELLEIFQWTPEGQSTKKASANRKAVEQEIADILYWLLLLSHDLGISPENALHEKLKVNGTKYPVSQSRGNSKKYDQF